MTREEMNRRSLDSLFEQDGPNWTTISGAPTRHEVINRLNAIKLSETQREAVLNLIVFASEKAHDAGYANGQHDAEMVAEGW